MNNQTFVILSRNQQLNDIESKKSTILTLLNLLRNQQLNIQKSVKKSTIKYS